MTMCTPERNTLENMTEARQDAHDQPGRPRVSRSATPAVDVAAGVRECLAVCPRTIYSDQKSGKGFSLSFLEKSAIERDGGHRSTL